jgi:hypothetical protein
MQKIKHDDDGEGMNLVEAGRLAAAQRVVIDGKFIHVYDHGEEIPEHHTVEAMLVDRPAPKAADPKADEDAVLARARAILKERAGQSA